MLVVYFTIVLDLLENKDFLQSVGGILTGFIIGATFLSIYDGDTKWKIKRVKDPNFKEYRITTALDNLLVGLFSGVGVAFALLIVITLAVAVVKLL